MSLALTSSQILDYGSEVCAPDRERDAALEEPAIRAMTGADLDQFRQHLLRLDDRSRRSRFGSDVCDAWLEGYADRTDLTSTTLIGYFDGASLRGVAELRSLTAQWHTEAEAAFSVEAAWQGKGIGTALMRAAIEAGKAIGLCRIHVIFDARNRPMARISEHVATSLDCDDGECIAAIALAKVRG